MSVPAPGADFSALPTTGAAVLDWTWADYAPFFAALQERPLDAAGADAWLADWTRISDLASEQGTRLHLASSADTRDDAKRARLEAFQTKLIPPALAADQALKQKLLDSGIVPPGLEIPLRNLRAEAERFREANLPLQVRQSELCNRYNRTTGSLSAEFEGRERTMSELRVVLTEQERERREQAWRLIGDSYRGVYGELAEIWAGLLDLRAQMAANAGCSGYQEYVWPLKHRFDYTPQDCTQYQRSVRSVVVPALARRHARLRDKLGVATLRPWDILADPLGRTPLRPFEDAAVLEAKCASIFEQLDPELGAQFGLLRDGLLDLANRPGKAPGGWCSSLPVVQRPFIFMNAVGLHNDVQTLLHEAGHAFHGFACYKLPYGHQRGSFMEFNEVASMAMELLAAPYLDAARGGFYDASGTARARIDHLDNMLTIWVMVAVGDAFQDWVYRHPQEAQDAARCGEVFFELWQAHHPELDLTGIEDYYRQRWMMTLHYFIVPFYYIEYGLAQLGAVQVWQNAQRDPAQALAQYKAGLALGGTVGIPELYAAAGAKFAFDEATFASCVGTLEQAFAELEPVAER
jgi:oligoendopeptidase F